MYKIPANTLFVGKNVIFVPECHSTNSLALDFIQKPSTAEGSVVITNHQTAGRGQRGNQWITEAAKNLTLSYILRPSFLPVKDQFQLNIITSLAVRDLLASMITHPVYIKWPNDILVQNRKICGILIENQIQGDRLSASVIGIGINVNQRNLPVSTATSVTLETGSDADLEECFSQLSGNLESRYLMLKQNKLAALREEYLEHFYWRNERHVFEHNGQPIEGFISGINEIGKLEITTAGGPKYFDVKEVSYIK